MAIVGNYVEMAEKHWREYRPAQYAAMTPQQRETFFDDLALQTLQQIADTWPSLAGTDPAGESTEEKIRRLATARFNAESAAIREILLPGPENQDEQDPDDDLMWANLPVTTLE